MRNVGERLTETLFQIAEGLHPGGTTRSLVPAAVMHLKRLRADTLADLTGFPSVLCASRNNVAAHGVPDDEPLEEGDLVTLDLAARIDGWWGDVAWTFVIGERAPGQSSAGAGGSAGAAGAPSTDALRSTRSPGSAPRSGPTRREGRLAQATRVRTAAWQACCEAVNCCNPGARIGDLAAAMAEAAHRHGCDIVPDFAGHGIGRGLHEPPAVTPRGLPGLGSRLIPGMVVTVEPVVVAGDCRVDTLNDGWTYVTRDGSLAAQFEVMVYVHGQGHETISFPRSRGVFPPSAPVP